MRTGVSGVRDREGCADGQTGRLICTFKRRVNYLCAFEEDVYSLQCWKEGKIFIFRRKKKKTIGVLQWKDKKINQRMLSMRLMLAIYLDIVFFFLESKSTFTHSSQLRQNKSSVILLILLL